MVSGVICYYTNPFGSPRPLKQYVWYMALSSSKPLLVRDAPARSYISFALTLHLEQECSAIPDVFLACARFNISIMAVSELFLDTLLTEALYQSTKYPHNTSWYLEI